MNEINEFLMLPVEILTEIASYLTFYEKCRLSLVCRYVLICLIESNAVLTLRIYSDLCAIAAQPMLYSDSPLYDTDLHGTTLLHLAAWLGRSHVVPTPLSLLCPISP